MARFAPLARVWLRTQVAGSAARCGPRGQRQLLDPASGGGAVGFLTDRAGLRFDLRYFSNLKPSDSPKAIALGPTQFSYWNASVGVVLRYLTSLRDQRSLTAIIAFARIRNEYLVTALCAMQPP